MNDISRRLGSVDANQLREQANGIAQQAESLAHPLAYASHTAQTMHAKALLIQEQAQTLAAWTGLQLAQFENGHADSPFLSEQHRDQALGRKCTCMTEDPGDGLGERVVTHSGECHLHPDA